MAQHRTTQRMTLEMAVECLRTLDENIIDMRRTANRIGERDGWQGELYAAISADLAQWVIARGRLAMRVRAMRRAAVAA